MVNNLTDMINGPDVNALIDRKEIARLLHEVPDPEIPGVSIVDLGMIIDIREENEHWRVDLAPTYSGCPAIDVIPMMIDQHLKASGWNNVVIHTTISPPWSTDWISEEGKEKLFDLGIAPPEGKAHMHVQDDKPKKCPQCGSEETMLISRYSSTPCKAAYRCLSCLEPFEYFKCF